MVNNPRGDSMDIVDIKCNLNRWQLKMMGKLSALATVATREQAVQLADAMFANRAVKLRIRKANGVIEEERIYPTKPASTAPGAKATANTALNGLREKEPRRSRFSKSPSSTSGTTAG